MELSTSEHGSWRMDNRSFSQELVGIYARHGRRSWSRGALSYSFDRATRQRLQRSVPPELYKRIERKLNGYVVIGLDGVVVTFAHRTRRRRRR